MSQIFSIIEQLAADNSRLAKEAILIKNKDNGILKRVINLALNPFIQFYIRKIPKYNCSSPAVINLEQALDKLEILSSRTLTGNAGIEHLTSILNSLGEGDAKVIERIIAKDLKCGVSEATSNKIWKDIVPTYPVMLASGYDQKLVDKISFPAYVQLKLDGMRFNAIVKNGEIEFRSRNGKELTIPSKNFAMTFVKMAEYYKDNMVFDGELLVVDHAGKPVNRQTGNGILSKSIKNTMSETEATNVRATLWDAIPYDNFIEGSLNEPYNIRLSKLSNCFSHIKNVYRQFAYNADLVWNKEVDNLFSAQQIFEKFLSEGQEGTILKSKNGIWENKRSKTQIKFKGELECELRIIDWEEGTGKNKGRLGALVCESEDGVIQVNVGSGYTDEQRDAYDKSVIGKIVTVKYNARIKERGDGKERLFLPVFIELREDKNIADSSIKIK
jgi:ATP-dependent DNA ligase